MLPLLISVIAAVAVLAIMYVRAPGTTSHDEGETGEIPRPLVVGALPGRRKPLITPTEPYRPGAGPAWITSSGEFEIQGSARRPGDLALVKVPLASALRRPPIASRVSDDSPPPGSASLMIRSAENCVESTLRVITSGRVSSDSTSLVLGVNAREAGALRLRGRFRVRG